MCKSKMNIHEPEPKSKSKNHPRTSPQPTTQSSSSSSGTTTTTNHRSSKHQQASTSSSSSEPASNFNTSTGSSYIDYSSRTSASSKASSSLQSFRDSLPETPHIYEFTEICTATNNFLAKRFSSSSSACWRCTIRGKDVVVFQRKFRRSIEASRLRQRLSLICKSHHISLIKLLGASVSGDHIFLVYNYVNGANLRDCLRNPNNPDFTVLSTWVSRMQVAADLAQGLEYIHHYTGLRDQTLVHNHIKSSSVLITEPRLNARICHFGTSELCGEIARDYNTTTTTSGEEGEITTETPPPPSPSKVVMKRSDSGKMKFSGTTGYMSPEFQSTGIPTQKSDVYAFGIVMLELLSGQESLRFRFDKPTGDLRRISLIDTAMEAILDESGGGGGGGGGGGRIRRWIDRRLKDSFPVEVAEKMVRLALDCVDTDPDKRPDMRRVAGKISKLYLESQKWAEKMRPPKYQSGAEFTVSLGPR